MVSQSDRIKAAGIWRTLYKTGYVPETKNPLTLYNRCGPYIEDLAAQLYSPVDLLFNFSIHGGGSRVERIKAEAAAADFNMQIRSKNIDTEAELAVKWALIKGKTFLKFGWSRDGIQHTMVHPEMMGVLEENKGRLSDQSAFVHRMYVTPDTIRAMVRGHMDANEANDLIKDLRKYAVFGVKDANPDQTLATANMIIGGTFYGMSGQQNAGKGQGSVQWLTNQGPRISENLKMDLLQLDELWVKNPTTNDYSTFQLVGSSKLIWGGTIHRNILAWGVDPNEKSRSGLKDEDNPLKGEYPFREVCPNPEPDNFWGTSALDWVLMPQSQLNKRIDGINGMLRKQEDPPISVTGTNFRDTDRKKLTAPGGWFNSSDPSSTVKLDVLAPNIPADLFESVQWYDGMFDRVAGQTAVSTGVGESGVRSQAHAETLVRTSSSRNRNRALRIERDIEAVGGLILSIFKAKVPEMLTAWVPPNLKTVETVPLQTVAEDPPHDGYLPIQFLYYNLDEKLRVSIESHSASPLFSYEAKNTIFELTKAGAISPKTLLRMIPIPDKDEAIADLEQTQRDHEQMIQKIAEKDPHEALKLLTGGKKK